MGLENTPGDHRRPVNSPANLGNSSIILKSPKGSYICSRVSLEGKGWCPILKNVRLYNGLFEPPRNDGRKSTVIQKKAVADRYSYSPSQTNILTMDGILLLTKGTKERYPG